MRTKYLIVHLINNLSLGGAQKLVSDLIIESKKEFNLAVIVLNNYEGLFDKIIEKEKIKIISFFPFSIKNFFEIIKLIKIADLIHVHLFPMLYLCAFIPIKKVFTEHNTWNRRRDLPFIRVFEKIIYKRYDGIISISNNTKEALSKWLGGIPSTYSPVIYNGIDLKKFSHKPLGFHGHRIGMMGTFSAQKDQKTIIHALKILPEKYSVIFAGDGDQEQKMIDLSKKLEINNRVIFLGRIINIDQYLNDIDIYVQSSNWEGFGLAPLEAMAKRIPTIGTNVEGLNEVIGLEKYLFKKNNAKDLARLIQNIFEKKISYVNAQEHSILQSNKFSIKGTNNLYSKLYKDVIK